VISMVIARSIPVEKRGMAAPSHPQDTPHGRRNAEAGGNAIDAASPLSLSKAWSN
jgi:gamma-glutamyltranspeptidase